MNNNEIHQQLQHLLDIIDDNTDTIFCDAHDDHESPDDCASMVTEAINQAMMTITRYDRIFEVIRADIRVNDALILTEKSKEYGYPYKFGIQSSTITTIQKRINTRN